MKKEIKDYLESLTDSKEINEILELIASKSPLYALENLANYGSDRLTPYTYTTLKEAMKAGYDSYTINGEDCEDDYLINHPEIDPEVKVYVENIEADEFDNFSGFHAKAHLKLIN